jgi:hypothetical protein
MLLPATSSSTTSVTRQQLQAQLRNPRNSSVAPAPAAGRSGWHQLQRRLHPPLEVMMSCLQNHHR